MSRWVRAVALLLLIAGFCAWPATRLTPARAASAPTGLPNYFGFGLSAQPDSTGLTGWMPNSGVPWNYAYQYLSGGVNTGSGWETWNTSGQFALWYAQSADSHGYIPVFPYYEMLQSNGSCGSCAEPQKDLSNLNNATLMASYFANFRLLMQRLGGGTYGGIAGFGKTAIVHVEPDLSGYAEQAVLDNTHCYNLCTAQGNNPAYLKASVASSGDADAQSYPNTYQGFNWALIHIRDLYAPNVRLAFHISNWATLQDISSSSDPSLNVVSLGQEAGSFAAQSGIVGVPSGTGTYDLLFNDVADRDAAYYKYVYNNPAVWWDRLNVAVPNFHRWEAYINAASVAAGRSVIVWQVPEGNQYYDTENNTDGHYQDNRAEYFYSHVPELVQNNIIAVLFGAGNGGSTVHNDGKSDGITNPAAICNTDGYSDGVARCASHTSAYSDDDGGYIRLQGQAYYAGGPYQLSGGTSPPTSTPAPTSIPTNTPAPTATPVPPTLTISNTSASPLSNTVKHNETLTGTVTFGGAASGVTVDYEVLNSAGSSVYSKLWTAQAFSANVGTTYTTSWKIPSNAAKGTYTFRILVTNGGSTTYGTKDSAGTFTVS